MLHIGDLINTIIIEIVMKNSNTTFKSNFAVAPGRYVKEHMEYYGYSYEKFADLCGCSVESVKEIVIDKVPLTLKLAKKFERELDIPAYALMRIEGDYRSRVRPVVKVKEREKKASSVVKQPFSVAQQFG